MKKRNMGKSLKELGKSVRNNLYYLPLIHARKRRIERHTKFKDPFLVTSAGSSGSHLLGILLDSHPNIMVGPEVFLLNKRAIYSNFSVFQQNINAWLGDGLPGNGPRRARGFLRGVNQYGWDRRMIPFLARETNTLAEFLTVFFGVMLLRRKKDMWGEKLPDNVNCISEFLHLYPQGRIIHLVRDGRDVAVSLGRRNITIRFAAESWLYSNAKALEWKTDKRVLFVKYEDLVTAPQQVLLQVQQHLGVEPCDLVNLRDNNSFWKKIIHSEKENIHQQWTLNPLFSPISTSSIGGYREKLSAEDLEKFLGFSSNQSEFEYPPGSPQTIETMLKYFDYIQG